MRLAAGVLLTFSVVTIASASAQPRGPRRIRPAPQRPPAAAELRGPQAPVAPAVTLSPIPAPAVSLAAQPAANPDECRRACSRAYYFCVAADGPDECGPSWGQCRTACTTPNYRARGG
jgi:hypothetical protein